MAEVALASTYTGIGIHVNTYTRKKEKCACMRTHTHTQHQSRGMDGGEREEENKREVLGLFMSLGHEKVIQNSDVCTLCNDPASCYV